MVSTAKPSQRPKGRKPPGGYKRGRPLARDLDWRVRRATTQRPTGTPRARLIPNPAHPRDHRAARTTARRYEARSLNVATDEQGRALSALSSGRCKVDPGTDDLIAIGEAPSPAFSAGLVGELRARDWIAATGELTFVGHDALRRWTQGANPS